MVAVTQATKLSWRACHNDCAAATASWVLPHDRRGPLHVSTSGTPGARALSTDGAVSGRWLKPSASGGVTPDQTGEAGAAARGPAGVGISVSLVVTGPDPYGGAGWCWPIRASGHR